MQHYSTEFNARLLCRKFIWQGVNNCLTINDCRRSNSEKTMRDMSELCTMEFESTGNQQELDDNSFCSTWMSILVFLHDRNLILDSHAHLCFMWVLKTVCMHRASGLRRGMRCRGRLLRSRALQRPGWRLVYSLSLALSLFLSLSCTLSLSLSSSLFHSTSLHSSLGLSRAFTLSLSLLTHTQISTRTHARTHTHTHTQHL